MTSQANPKKPMRTYGHVDMTPLWRAFAPSGVRSLARQLVTLVMRAVFR